MYLEWCPDSWQLRPSRRVTRRPSCPRFAWVSKVWAESSDSKFPKSSSSSSEWPARDESAESGKSGSSSAAILRSTSFGRIEPTKNRREARLRKSGWWMEPENEKIYFSKFVILSSCLDFKSWQACFIRE